jgi:hypothetical protein
MPFPYRTICVFTKFIEGNDNVGNIDMGRIVWPGLLCFLCHQKMKIDDHVGELTLHRVGHCVQVMQDAQFGREQLQVSR